MVSMYITATSLEFAKDAFNKQQSLLVVSNNYEEISKVIMAELKRGITYIEAEGAYTKNKKKLIYCIVDSNELGRIKEIVYQIDSNAFVSINDTNECAVLGVLVNLNTCELCLVHQSIKILGFSKSAAVRI